MDNQPNPDTRTYRERQDAAIAELQAHVAALEAALQATLVAVPILGIVDWDTDAVTWTCQPPEVRP